MEVREWETRGGALWGWLRGQTMWGQVAVHDGTATLELYGGAFDGHKNGFERPLRALSRVGKP